MTRLKKLKAITPRYKKIVTQDINGNDVEFEVRIPLRKEADEIDAAINSPSEELVTKYYAVAE